MNTSKKIKRIILIWDFDGPIGLINATFPYNFGYDALLTEIENVYYILEKLDSYNIKSCFAITGFSAEKGIFPFMFPDLINEISIKGHEIASHSWKHEWIPKFSKNQIVKSLKRSKSSLEEAINFRQKVFGFVPPHNRPMTWLSRFAISFGDQSKFPFMGMGNNDNLIKLLVNENYKWVRVSYQNIFQKIGLLKKNVAGKIFYKNKILIFENHYNGFDEFIINHILESNNSTFTISAHPLMMSKNNKESKENFENFLNKLKLSNQPIEFVLPSSFLHEKRN